MPSSGSAKVAPSKRAGSARMSATVQPLNSSSSKISSTSGSRMPSHCRATIRLAAAIETPVRSAMRGACRTMKAARAFAASGLSSCLALALSSSSLAVSTIGNGGQAATVFRASPSTATGRRLSRSCSSGGSRTGPPSNTRRSGPPTMRSMTDRSSSCPAAPTIIHPRPACQQRSCRALRKRSTSVPSCTNRYTWRPSDPGSRSPVSERNSPALVERRVTRATLLKAGSTDSSASQKPPRRFSSAATSGGMPFVSKSSSANAGCPFL
jgi:hypothetical protein